MPRISDLGHLYSSSLGKLELDMMGSQLGLQSQPGQGTTFSVTLTLELPRA